MVITIAFFFCFGFAFGYFFGELRGMRTEAAHSAELLDCIETVTLKPGSDKRLLCRAGLFHRGQVK